MARRWNRQLLRLERARNRHGTVWRYAAFNGTLTRLYQAQRKEAAAKATAVRFSLSLFSFTFVAIDIMPKFPLPDAKAHGIRAGHSSGGGYPPVGDMKTCS